jgi:hypothetical protein
MRKIYILDQLNSQTDELFREGIAYYSIWLKRDEQKDDLKDNIYYVLTIEELPTKDIAIIPRYPDRKLFSEFLQSEDFTEDINKLAELIKEQLSSNNNSELDIQRIIDELNKEYSSQKFYLVSYTEPEKVNDIKNNVINWFAFFKNDVYAPYEPHIIDPNSEEFDELLTKLAEQYQKDREEEKEEEKEYIQEQVESIMEQAKVLEDIKLFKDVLSDLY